jgi:hypothetical protein
VRRDRDHVGLELVQALQLGVLAHRLGVAPLELGLGALALADVLVVRDVADARAAGVAHGADPHLHVQLATIAAAVDQLAGPGADRGVGDRRPHVAVERVRLPPRLQHPRVLPDHLAQRVAEQVEEGAVDVDDPSRRIGEHHTLGAGQEVAVEQRQPVHVSAALIAAMRPSSRPWGKELAMMSPSSDTTAQASTSPVAACRLRSARFRVSVRDIGPLVARVRAVGTPRVVTT